MFRRVLSILLCGCMLAGSLPVMGLAAEEQAVGTVTEAAVENAGGGYNDDTPAQVTENGDSESQETEEKKEGTEAPGEDETEGNEAISNETAEITETTVEPEETRESEATTEVQTESVTESESVTEETAETETEIQTEETGVNKDEDENTAPRIKDVQEEGYLIVTDIEVPTQGTVYLFWREEGKGYNGPFDVTDGTRKILYPTKPNRTYILELRSGTGTDSELLDEWETKTSDYKFQAAAAVEVETVTTDSAQIKVEFSDYSGIYPGGDYVYLYAGTDYTDALGGMQTGQDSFYISSDSVTKTGTVTISVSNLKAATEYTLPIWVSEYNASDGLKKKLCDVTFMTKESSLAGKLQLEAKPDAEDMSKVNYTISLNDSDTLTDSYQYRVGYGIKGAPESDGQTVEGSLYQSSQYMDTGSISNLYAGTEYELRAVVDGVVATAEFFTASDGITPEISTTPLSLGEKIRVKLTGVPETSDAYTAKAYVMDGFWRGIYVLTKSGNGSSDMNLTAADSYQGEWLLSSHEFIGAGSSYDIKVDILKNGTVIASKYHTLNTSEMSLKLEVERAAGKMAQISCEVVDADEYFEWRNEGYADLYYRVKGSNAAWEKSSSSVRLDKNGKQSARLSKLSVDTEYEVKITAYDNEDIVYGTTEFRTTEGVTEGAFSNLDVRIGGFNVSVYGHYTPSDYSDKTEIYLIEKDSKGEVLTETNLYYNENNKYVSTYTALRMETAKIQLKAVETLDEKDAAGNAVKKEYLTREYTRESVPKDISFSVSNIDTGVTTLHMDMTYSGDMCLTDDMNQTIYAQLYYRTSNETDEYGIVSWVVYGKDQSKTQVLTFSGLKANTTYHGRLVIYVENQGENIYKQEIALEDFTTKENKTYQLKTAFPDEQFRELVVRAAGLSSEVAEVTAAQLEQITEISANRTNFDMAVVKDLTGIELLTGIRTVSLMNHEISDTPAVNWSKLKGLNSLNLSGNELEKIPNLSKNVSLNWIDLNENKIPAEEFAAVSERLPGGVKLSGNVQSSQRVGGLLVIAEKTYYQRDGKSPLLIKVKGYRTQLPYTFKYFVDGKEVSFPSFTWSSDDKIWYNLDTGIQLGEHKLTVEMYQGGEKKEDEKEVTFQMAKEGAFLQDSLLRFNAQQEYYNVWVYSDKKVAAAYMMQNGSIAATRLSDIYVITTGAEYRYKTLNGNGNLNLEGLGNVFGNNFGLFRAKNQYPDAGIYDLKVVYEDETEEILPGVIEIVSKAFIQRGDIGYSYDSTGGFFYLSIYGYGFDASKLEYSFFYNEKQQPAEYINAKRTSDGYIVKFRKSDTWTPKEGDSVTVRLAPKDGYDAELNTDIIYAYISQGIYYCAYSGASNKVEVGVTSNLRKETVTFNLSRYNTSDDASNDRNPIETIEVNPETVAENVSYLLYLLPVKNNEVYELPSGWYRLDMVCGDYKGYKTFSVSRTGTNYWSNARYVGEGASGVNFFYYTDIPFGTADKEDFRAELTGGDLTSPLGSQLWAGDYAYRTYTAVGMLFDMSNLAQGDYTITLYYKNEEMSSYTVTVIPTDKFVMTNDNYPTATWIDDSSFRVYFYTVNTAESDKFTVSLTDIDNNPVSGLTTEVTNRYSDSVYLTVTGLSKKDAYKYYYIKITHNKLGEAYKPDRTTEFFADKQGKYTQISDGRFTYPYRNNRVIGIGAYHSVAFPVTVKIYKPYDTELVTSFTINKNDLESGTSNPAFYYFNQSLIDALPDKDARYDIVLEDAEGQTGFYTNPIGLRESDTAEWTVSPTRLNLNLSSDEAKTGTITVTGNKGTPTFKSENETVATVAVDSADKNKAVVTAVAEGTVSITITADDLTKTVVVTVTEAPIQATGISIVAPESMSVGRKENIEAVVMPAGAWTQQSSITWTTSDSSVISIPAGSNGLVVEATALKAGSAVITAVLDGTDFKASCKITVEKKNLSDDEQDELAKKIDTLYFLEGADSSLADMDSKLPDGWSWNKSTEKPVADNSHPVQNFRATYNKDDVSFDRYLNVYVSKLDDVRIVGKSTVGSQKEATYTCAFTYTGADLGSGYEISWRWTPGQNLAIQKDTGKNVTVKVSGDGKLSVTMTVTNTTTGKTVSKDASLDISAGEIPDSKPELENKKITIYKNSTQYVPIGLVAKDGNSITSVELSDTAFKTFFETKQDEKNGDWLIGLTDSGKGNYTKKATEKLSLTVKTEFGTEYKYTRALSVTVDVTDITTKNVKFKQTLKPNVAYSDTNIVKAEFSVSSKYIIEDITAVSGTEKFAVKSYDSASGTLVLEAKTEKLDSTTKSYLTKVEVKVKDYGTKTLELKVAVQNKKPSLKLGDAVVLKGVSTNASAVLSSGKTELSFSDYVITETEGTGVTLAEDGSAIKVTYTGDKNGKYTATIRKNTWAPDVKVKLKGKVSVLDPKKAKLSADRTKTTINITEGYSAPATVTVGIKGSSVSVDLTAKPAKEKDEKAVTVDNLGNGKIRITPNSGATKGNYKVTVNGSVGGVAVKSMTITVALTDKAPEVKLSAKGKINLANREGTSIVYTPTLKNLPETLSIQKVEMDRTTADSDSDYFNAKLTDEDKKITMTAVTGKTMNAKKYKPVLIFTLSNGKTVKTGSNFTVSVTNKLPKVTVTTLSSALCTSNAEHRAAYQLNAGNGYTISNVAIEDTNYRVTYESSTGTAYVSLSDTANVITGKKYSVSCKVYIKGADNTTKPLTVKLKTVIY